MTSRRRTKTTTLRCGAAVAEIQLHTEKPEENKKATWDFIWANQLDKPEIVSSMLVEVAHVSHEYPGTLEVLSKNLNRFQEPKSFPADIEFVKQNFIQFTVKTEVKWVCITNGNSYYHPQDCPKIVFVDENGITLPMPLECPICLGNIQQEEKAIRFPCQKGHHFHPSCLLEWLSKNNRCPICVNHIKCTDTETNRLIEAIILVNQYIKQQEIDKQMFTLSYINKLLNS
jgi:hypothetical protein